MATNTVPSKQTHTAANNASGNTSGPYAISFDYLLEADVQVSVNGVLKTQETHYTFPSKTQILFTTDNFPTIGQTIEIKRNTDITTPKVDFQDGSVLTESDLDNNSKHILFGMQETKEDVEGLVSTFVGATAPTDVLNGARWFDTVSGRTFVYYVDTDSAQWIEANPPFAATLELRLNDVINVKDYGATGNGSTDDRQSIQNAINAVSSTGGKVVFPAGKYKLGSSLTITQTANQNAVILQGLAGNSVGLDNYGARLFRADGDTDPFITITNARSVHIKDLCFIGGEYANGGNSKVGVKPNNDEAAIDVTANAGCQEHLYENLTFNGITQCISLKGLSSSLISNCKVRQVPEGVDGNAVIRLTDNGNEPIDQIRIENCIIDGSPNPSGSTVAGLVSGAINSTIKGIVIDNTVSTVYVTNTSVIRTQYSYFINSTWDGNFCYFQNAEAERAKKDGFSLNGSGNYITLDNCFACTCEENGINIGTQQNSSVNMTNPNVRDNKHNGILIDSPTQNVSIVNPAIGGNSRASNNFHGINIPSSTNHVYIAGGKVGGQTTDLSGTGPQNYGIIIQGDNHDHIRIIGVDVSGNQQSSGISWQTSGANVQAASDNFIQFCAGYSTGQTTFP